MQVSSLKASLIEISNEQEQFNKQQQKIKQFVIQPMLEELSSVGEDITK